ncbi:hypothetical protein PMAYCL1PPCAC_10089, partial [Pristionchus mayeri]
SLVMSAKAVEERRLRLVYDALDNYNAKAALKESEKVLKKHPGMQTAKVLRALALIRLERLTEAVQILEEVQANLDDYEESTLQAFVHCFKELNQPERICELYAKAVAAKPDENYYSHLFMSYARVCNYKDQQKTALALNRIAPSQPYYLWAVMSVIMQATENPEMGKKMLLPLAEKMLTKIYDENKQEWKNSQQIELNVLVLEKQGRKSEAADLLESPGAAALLTPTAGMLLIRVLQLRADAKQWAVVLEKAEEGLWKTEAAVDQWLLWVHLLDAAFALAEEAGEMEEKMKFIDRAFAAVVKACETAPTYRGPYMAHFEFVARAQRVGVHDPEKHGDAVALLVAYARRFHSKPTCFIDLIKWLHMAGSEERQAEVEAGISAIVDEEMKKSLETREKGDDDTDLPTTSQAECWSIVLHERVRRWYGREVAAGPQERRSRVLRLARSQLHVSGVPQAAASLTLLAAEGAYLCYRLDGDARALYEAMLLLETAARAHSEDYLARLILMHLYTLLGVPSRMRALSEQLDIKMVQRDSLGHLGFHAAEIGGHVHFGSIHYTSLGEFYDLADREISECIVSAYKNGSFAQIEGVVGMRRRMRKSIMAVAADVANRWISAAFSLKVIEHVVTIMKGDEDPAEWESLSDNRDYTIIPACDQQLADEIKQYGTTAREEMIDLSRLRHLIMRVSAAVARGSIEAGRGLFANLTEQLAHCKATYTEEQTPPPGFANTPPAFLGEWVHGPFLAPLLRLLSGALDAIEAGGDEKGEAERLPSETEMSSLYSSLVAAIGAAIDTPPTRNTVLPLSTAMRLSSRAAQSIAFCRQLLRIISLRLVGEKTTASKKAVRDSLAALSEATRRAGDELGEQMERARERLEQAQDECFPTVDEAFWNVEWAALLLSEKKEVDVTIARAHTSAIQELQACLKS